MTGAQLKKWRQRLQATQLELAAELGVAESTISRLEQRATIERKYHVALAAIATLWRSDLPEDPQ